MSKKKRSAGERGSKKTGGGEFPAVMLGRVVGDHLRASGWNVYAGVRLSPGPGPSRVADIYAVRGDETLCVYLGFGRDEVVAGRAAAWAPFCHAFAVVFPSNAPASSPAVGRGVARARRLGVGLFRVRAVAGAGGPRWESELLVQPPKNSSPPRTYPRLAMVQRDLRIAGSRVRNAFSPYKLTELDLGRVLREDIEGGRRAMPVVAAVGRTDHHYGEGDEGLARAVTGIVAAALRGGIAGVALMREGAAVVLNGGPFSGEDGEALDAARAIVAEGLAPWALGLTGEPTLLDIYEGEARAADAYSPTSDVDAPGADDWGWVDLAEGAPGLGSGGAVEARRPARTDAAILRQAREWFK